MLAYGPTCPRLRADLSRSELSAGRVLRHSLIHSTSNGQNECSSASNYPRKTRSIDIYECDFLSLVHNIVAMYFLHNHETEIKIICWKRQKIRHSTGTGTGARSYIFTSPGICKKRREDTFFAPQSESRISAPVFAFYSHFSLLLELLAFLDQTRGESKCDS